MKNKKFKLFASLTSLVMVVAVMAVGVWAATSASVSATAHVKFSATGVTGTITGTLTGLGAPKYYNSDNTNAGQPIAFNPSTTLDAWTVGDAENPVAITNESGVPVNVVYSFTINNASTTHKMGGSINDLTVGESLAIDSVKQDSNPITVSDGDYALTDFAETTTVVVTLKVKNASASFANETITFALELVQGAAKA